MNTRARVFLVAVLLPAMVLPAVVETTVQAFRRDAGSGYELIPTRHAAPEYPRSALRQETGGWVDVQFTVGVDGTVEQVDVVDSEPKRIFDRAALRAALKWRFKAPEEDGLDSSQKAVFRFVFAIE